MKEPSLSDSETAMTATAGQDLGVFLQFDRTWPHKFRRPTYRKATVPWQQLKIMLSMTIYNKLQQSVKMSPPSAAVRSSHHSQECKDPRLHCFCDSWPL